MNWSQFFFTDIGSVLIILALAAGALGDLWRKLPWVRSEKAHKALLERNFQEGAAMIRREAMKAMWADDALALDYLQLQGYTREAAQRELLRRRAGQ